MTAATPGRPARRPDASMTLLREVMERPLDPGYAAAAARPRRGGRGRVAVTALLAVVAGYVLAVSAAETRIPEPESVRAAERLRERIEARAAAVDGTAAATAALRVRIAAAQTDALRSAGGTALVERARTLGLVTGELPATGPGLRITVEDAPGSRAPVVGGDPRAGSAAQAGIVLDSDLQIVVNGLWAAGAEAIAVNGQRLSALSAIRSAGEAVLVDFRPLVPPYVIDVLGAPDRLETGLAAGAAGAYVQSMRDNSGIGVAIEPVERIAVPAASRLVLRAARPVPSPSPAAPAPSPGPAAPSRSVEVP